MVPPALRLLLITDRKLAKSPFPEVVEAALSAAPPGSIALQLREKDLDAHALAELASALLPLCRARKSPLLINDRIDIALALGLDGVHLPQASFKADDARRLLVPGSLIGVSCHSVGEVQEAQRQGADYATFGPLFDTPSKRKFGTPVGLEQLQKAAQGDLPLYGLGGVSVLNAPDVRRSGAFGVAAIGAWLDTTHGSPEDNIKALLGG